MILFFQNNGILSWGLRHVGDVGAFNPSISKAAQIKAFCMLSVGVDPNIKPQLKKHAPKPNGAKVSSNIEVSEGGYSPYGRGQTLQVLPIPYGKASARDSKVSQSREYPQRSGHIGTAVLLKTKPMERNYHEY